MKMKKADKPENNKDPCKGCPWGKKLNESVAFCPFPRCVKKDHGKEKENCQH